MVFSSPIFILLFLPLVFLFYFIPFAPARMRASIGWKNFVLIVFSLFFYAWGEGLYVLAMLGCITFNWIGSLLLARYPARRTAILYLGVAGNLLFLAYYKYAGFIYQNFIEPLPVLGLLLKPRLEPQLMAIHMPIGISFFTFQAMSYLIDAYRGDVKVERNWFKLCLFKSFFPQLIAGPIVRYRDITAEITSRNHTLEDFSCGVRRFIAGFAQKVIIANTLGAVADRLFSTGAAGLSTSLAWIAAVAYAFQIYFDFCGYSNMAIGIARIFGFHFLENFNYPYISRSITEFWRRWHISLSTWFRDYLYIPLGGNRRGDLITYRNLLLVFLLCGLWHGAEWHFVVWGLFHGIFLVIERVGFGERLKNWPRPISHVYALLVIIAGWVLFRADTLAEAGAILARMAGFGGGTTRILVPEVLTPEVLFCFVLATVFSTPLGAALASINLKRTTEDRQSAGVPATALSLCAHLGTFVFALSYLAAGSFNPFIYFRF